MELDYKQIGARIKAERNNMRLSQAQLAELVDLSVKYLSQVERGVRHLSLDSIAKIAVALNASVDLLLFGACHPGFVKIFSDCKAFDECDPNKQNVILDIALAAKKILHNYKIIV